MRHMQNVLYFVLCSIIAVAIVSSLPMSFEKVFLYIVVFAVDIAYVIGWIRRML